MGRDGFDLNESGSQWEEDLKGCQSHVHFRVQHQQLFGSRLGCVCPGTASTPSELGGWNKNVVVVGLKLQLTVAADAAG